MRNRRKSGLSGRGGASPQVDAVDEASSGSQGKVKADMGTFGYDYMMERTDRIQQQLDALVGLVNEQQQQTNGRMDKIQQQLDTLVGSVAELQQQQTNQVPVQPEIRQEKYMEVSFHEFMETQPPIFSGLDYNADPNKFLEESNKCVKALGCSPVRAVELVSFQLKDIANEWYTSLVQKRQSNEPPLEWPEFSEAFLQKFFPESMSDAKVREFEMFRQTDGMSVMEYDIRFTHLSKYAPDLVPTEKFKVHRFVNGLQFHLSRYIYVADTTNYDQVVKRALQLESLGLESDDEEEPRKKAKFESQTFDWDETNEARVEKPYCENCGRHHFGVCRRGTGACFRCGQVGHFVRDCPNNLPQSSSI